MNDRTSQIRVLRIIARLNVGGPAIHTILLTQLLSPARFTSTLVTGCVSPSEGDMRYLAEEKGVEPLLIAELGREIHWYNDLIACWKLYRLMHRLRPTIVHTHTAKAGMLGRLAAKFAGVPVLIHTFHGHVFHSYFSPLKTRVFIGIERTLAKFTDAIITVSPKQRAEILSYGIGQPENIHAIELGLELDEFVHCEARRGKLRQELKLEAETPLIGIVARLVPVKGHTYFLEAAKQVLRTSPQARFVVVGDGELRETLELYAHKLGIHPQVVFLGWRQDLAEIYADLDVVVLSSLNEGSPVALIEAMAAGKPVVAADVGGVRDLVQHEHSGFLVPAKNSEILAGGIRRMLSLTPAERAQMGRHGRDSVYPKYHITRLAQDIEMLYEQLLQQHNVV